MQYRCPICKKTVKKVKSGKNKADKKDDFFPFCSERCRLIDLGHWFDSDYVVSTPADEKKKEDDEDSEN